MENIKIKKLNNSVGRKPYIPDMQFLKELYIKIKNKEMTNEERLVFSTVAKKQSGMN